MLIDLDTALLHLKADHSDEDALVELWIAAAQRTCEEFINRRVYADADALADALATAPAALAAAVEAEAEAVDAAREMESDVEAGFVIEAARAACEEARAEARRVAAGIVADETIKAAVLLILGMLYVHREQVAAGITFARLPMGALHLLQPYRIGMGV